MELHPKVTCILVNWNGWHDTIACLKALEESTYPDTEVLVVDNGSTDGSVTRIRQSFPNILLIENDANLGFAGGNNLGIRYAIEHRSDFIWLLNNDTKPSPDALSALVKKAVSDPQIGAVGSVLYYMSDPSKVQVWGGARVNLWFGYGRNTTKPHEDAWFDALYGASMLVRVNAILEVGMLDEGFFHYVEETELCVRLRKKQWKLAAAPNSRVLHRVSASTKGNSNILTRYFTTSMLRLIRLHAPLPPISMFFFLVIRLGKRFMRLQWKQCRDVLSGVKDYLCSDLAQKIQ